MKDRSINLYIYRLLGKSGFMIHGENIEPERYEMPGELPEEEQAEKLGEYLKQAFIRNFKKIE